MHTIVGNSGDQIRVARNRLLDGQNAPAKLVADSVAQSWERSRRHGIARAESRMCGVDVRQGWVKQIREQRRDLMNAMLPEVDILRGALADPNWVILCVDAEGVLIELLGCGSSVPHELREALKPGRTVSESDIGTTAPGCVLVEQRPVVINNNEHFLEENADLVCLAAPIFSPEGRLAGVIDITGLRTPQKPALLEAVIRAARAVENRLLVTAGNGHRVISLHHDPRLIGSPLEGIILVSRDNRLVAANRAARDMLSLETLPSAGLELAEVFSNPYTVMHRSSRDQVDIGPLTCCRSQAQLYVRLRERTSPVPTACRSGLAEATGGDLRVQDNLRPNTGFVCNDEQAQASFERARRAFLHDLPIVIQGETGTGKEVVARALHHARRPRGPFVPINCSAIPEGLIESELFGYVDGAFTGGRKGGAAGKVEQANGGTLFLDEIGDMPLALQTRLLRVLQDRSLTRVGGAGLVCVDISVICATHRDLKLLVAQQSFRQDLYYRLAGSSISLPPLRRRGDIEDLIDHFLERESGPIGAPTLSSEARRALLAYSWPGNIRQLQQVIRTSIATTDDGTIALKHLPEDLSDAPCTPSEYGGTQVGLGLRDTEVGKLTIERVRRALAVRRDNISAAARDLGISRGTLYKRIQQMTQEP